MFNLQGRISLVTGAARGLGQEIAKTLARHGAEVFAADRDAAALQEAVAGAAAERLRLRPLALDVVVPESWDAAIGQIGAEFGKLDVLVNNAGIMQMRRFFDTTLEDFRHSQQVNCESVFIGAKASCGLLTKGGELNPAGSSIINMSSILGQIAAEMNTSYCASKGAVRMLTKALAVDLGRAGLRIRVNSVHPGGVDTDLGRGGLQAMIDAGILPNMAAAEQLMALHTPLGRFAKVDDVAGVVLFLASDASKFVTGAELTVDGGFSVI